MKPAYAIQTAVTRYGASVGADGVSVQLFTETIRNGRLAWKKTGTAKWDARHGLYAMPHLPSGVAEALDAIMHAAIGVK